MRHQMLINLINSEKYLPFEMPIPRMKKARPFANKKYLYLKKIFIFGVPRNDLGQAGQVRVGMF